jgi:hypothetical protein
MTGSFGWMLIWPVVRPNGLWTICLTVELKSILASVIVPMCQHHLLRHLALASISASLRRTLTMEY